MIRMRSSGSWAGACIAGLAVFLFTTGTYAGIPSVPAEENPAGPHAAYVGWDGLVVPVVGGSPLGVLGPGLAGEVSFVGSWVPGFLTKSALLSIVSAFPGCAGCRTPPGESGTVRDLLVVVVDAGHGGPQRGAVSASGKKEKDLVLQIARRVRTALLRVEGVDVVMTRTEDQDISLEERVETANLVRADLFISIHANSFTSASLGGVETFFHSIEASGDEARRVASAENAPRDEGKQPPADALSLILEDMQSAEKLRDSSRLAHLVQEQLAGTLPFENRGVMQADFTVLRGTRMPSILVELGFLSNPREEKALLDPSIQDKVSEAIRQGILGYWDLAKRKQVPAAGEMGGR